MKNAVEEISLQTWKNPTEQNWRKLSNALKKSNVRYYKAVYPDKFDNAKDLRGSYVKLYDEKERLVAKAPLFMKRPKGVGGTTIYLKGLQIIRG